MTEGLDDASCDQRVDEVICVLLLLNVAFHTTQASQITLIFVFLFGRLLIRQLGQSVLALLEASVLGGAGLVL